MAAFLPWILLLTQTIIPSITAEFQEYCAKCNVPQYNLVCCFALKKCCPPTTVPPPAQLASTPTPFHAAALDASSIDDFLTTAIKVTPTPEIIFYDDQNVTETNFTSNVSNSSTLGINTTDVEDVDGEGITTENSSSIFFESFNDTSDESDTTTASPKGIDNVLNVTVNIMNSTISRSNDSSVNSTYDDTNSTFGDTNSTVDDDINFEDDNSTIDEMNKTDNSTTSAIVSENVTFIELNSNQTPEMNTTTSSADTFYEVNETTASFSFTLPDETNSSSMLIDYEMNSTVTPLDFYENVTGVISGNATPQSVDVNVTNVTNDTEVGTTMLLVNVTANSMDVITDNAHNMSELDQSNNLTETSLDDFNATRPQVTTMPSLLNGSDGNTITDAIKSNKSTDAKINIDDDGMQNDAPQPDISNKTVEQTSVTSSTVSWNKTGDSSSLIPKGSAEEKDNNDNSTTNQTESSVKTTAMTQGDTTTPTTDVSPSQIPGTSNTTASDVQETTSQFAANITEITHQRHSKVATTQPSSQNITESSLLIEKPSNISSIEEMLNDGIEALYAGEKEDDE